ncbi:MAG: DUF169 domain-containing protein [Acidobacteria bacterium]|nr:DUF169 domain-containing protein [Acidobacteriota bacterium]
MSRQPDLSLLRQRALLSEPVVGFYDAPSAEPFTPRKSPAKDSACTFAYFTFWQKGGYLHLTAEHFGCGGAGYWLCGRSGRPRDAFIDFLVKEEGLKADGSLMDRWLDDQSPYQQEHPHLLVGPLLPEQYAHLKTVTFFVNPDQLSLFMIGAQYHAAPTDPPPVLAPFGSGCLMLVAAFPDLDLPQAVIGATDIAMRQYLPPYVLAFTVTKSMLERLCALDEESFLFKPFWNNLTEARGLAMD